MKALLICPDERAGVAALATTAPLSNLPILGKCLVEYWLEYLEAFGAKEVLILATDRPEQVHARVGNGARWGLRAMVQTEKRELTPGEARAKHQSKDRSTWLREPHDVILMDHLPGRPQLPLATNYADWFTGTRALMPHAMTPDRIGLRELKPGVWVGLNARVSAGATLIGPCWIGERVQVEAGAVIGPDAVVENDAFIARGASVAHSIIGPKTFVGQFTEVRNSIAWGGTLVNWERDSCLKVIDDFLLCSLEPHRAQPLPANAAAPDNALLSAIVRLREYVTQLLI